MKVLITDHGFPNVDEERRIVEESGAQFAIAQCKTAQDVIEAAHDADALLVQFAPITAEVLSSLPNCKVIVRYGIGVDNIDLAAAKTYEIPICNVPDYCLAEVADHAVSLALALARQLPIIDRRVRSGVWKLTPDHTMPAFSEMTFGTAGFGRIAREVLKRAAGFGFRLAAYDPFVPDEAFEAAGVQKMSMEQLLQSDILSLHLPLNAQTQHIIDAQALQQMKRHAIVVNTARGPLIDTLALADALKSGVIAAAGLDVFDEEPLAPNHPLRECDNAILTSHVAWFSQSSVPKLQAMAAEEAVRGLRGQPLRNQVSV